MDERRIGEMTQLNCLLEKHKQLQERSAFKSYYQSQERQNNLNIHNAVNDQYYHGDYMHQENLPCTMNKVYVNPNYNRKMPVIHINPRVQMKPSIYVNPKIIKNFANTPSQEQMPTQIIQDSRSVMHNEMPNKKSCVHINPKLMNKLISNVPEENQHENIVSNIQATQSLSLIPIITVKQDEPITVKTEIDSTNVCTSDSDDKSTIELVKNHFQKRSPNSSFVSLSRRKLIRVRRSPRLSVASASSSKSVIPSRRKLSSSRLKKSKSSPKNVTLNSTSELFKIDRLKLIRNIDRYGLNYNQKIISSKKRVIATKKILNNSAGLVSIGGVIYKKSRTRLVRSNSGVSPVKRKNSLTSDQSDEYFIAENGKKLLKLDSSEKTFDKSSDSIKLNVLISPVKNYKTNVSNKVKQRSLQILRNKMRKNNQPCLLFQKFGFCSNQLNDTCPKVHDKKQVAVCKNFLQGKCLLDDCPLSHDVGPEKMPTCKYFLEGCCSRDGCPYLHVKVSSKSPICVEFLRGYCLQGNECQKRHIHACPEFDKSGKCSKGKFCPYPHKSHLTETKRFRKISRRKNNASIAKESSNTPTEPKPAETRKRYYDETSEDLSQKREKLLKSVKLIKDVHAAQTNNESEEKDNNSVKQTELHNVKDSTDCEEELEVMCKRPRRPPIGPLPAYIPID